MQSIRIYVDLRYRHKITAIASCSCRPRHVTMTSMHVVVSSRDVLCLWHYARSNTTPSSPSYTATSRLFYAWLMTRVRLFATLGSPEDVFQTEIQYVMLYSGTGGSLAASPDKLNNPTNASYNNGALSAFGFDICIDERVLSTDR